MGELKRYFAFFEDDYLGNHITETIEVWAETATQAKRVARHYDFKRWDDVAADRDLEDVDGNPCIFYNLVLTCADCCSDIEIAELEEEVKEDKLIE